MRVCNAAIALALLSGSACADDNWVSIASNNNAAWYGKSGSAGFGTIDKKFPSVYAAFKETKTGSDQIRVFKGGVKQSDCDNEQGKFLQTDMDGNYVASNDFIFGAGSFASEAAEVLCAFYQQNKKTGKKKK